MERSSLSGGELLLVVAGLLALIVGGVVWSGAAISSALVGVPFGASLSDALSAIPRLGSNPGDPAAAWLDVSDLSSVPVALYWACTAFCSAVAVGVIAGGVRLWGRVRVGTAPRRPLGVDARARFGRARDLKPLIVSRPEVGRFILGRSGRHLLASEHRDRLAADRRLPLRGDPRAGDRGAIALVGPSRSGKTTAVVSGVLEWQGPAVLSSVKDDLLRVTAGYRATQGDVAIFDPTKSTGLGTAVWSPLRQASTTLGAQRAARALVEAAPKGSNVDGGVDFWMAQAEMLLAALLLAAHHTGRDMGVVAEWVLTQDRPGNWGPGEVKAALDQVMLDGTPEEQIAAGEAARSLVSLWDDDERTRASVYSTARTVVWPWAEPGMAESSRGRSVDLEWLLDGPNSLYLCAPIEDQARLAPAFGGFLNDIIKQVYLRVASTGHPLDPPLLIVIDEAGNTPLRPMPEYASTLAGLGVLLVTVWQSLAQIEATYGRQTGTILSNHLSKLFYAGLSDPDSMRYVAGVLGDEEVETSSRTDDLHGGKGSRQLSTSRAPLAAPHVLRQMLPGDALLVHGTLPPAHVRTRPYYREKTLRRRARIPVPQPEPRQASSLTDGYGTNWMAIRMIYHPVRRVGIGPFAWQGIAHRLSDKLAREMASTITAVVSPHEIVDRIKIRELLASVDQDNDEMLDELLRAVVDGVEPGHWASLDRHAIAQTRAAFLDAAGTLDIELRDTLIDNADQLLDIEELTVELLAGPNSARLAEISRNLGARELRFIEAYGAVFGFGIGLAQVVVYQLLAQWWLLPIVGAIVGAATNYLALAMIFQPLEPTKYLGIITYQGMFPRRQSEIAAQFAAVIADELLTARQIVQRLATASAAPVVMQAALIALNDELPTILEPALGRAPVSGDVTAAAMALTQLPAATADQLLDTLDRHVDLESLVHERLAAMPKKQFERLLHGMFEEDEGILIVIGGVLGATAGIVQALLL